MKSYKQLRAIVFEGNLRIVRDEMLGVLYKLYIHQLVKIATGIKAEMPHQEDIFEELSSYRRDFQDFHQFSGEVNKALETFQQKDVPMDAKIKKLKEILKTAPSKLPTK